MRLFQRKKRAARRAVAGERDNLNQQFPDFDAEKIRIIEEVQPFTMTSPERIGALVDSIRYLNRHQIDGAVVECGVWRGGSMLAAIRTMQQTDCDHRDFWLYDTFEGMTDPTEADVDFLGRDAITQLSEQDPDDPKSIWCRSRLTQVMKLIAATSYPDQRLHFIQGPVEKTIPENVPSEIALLRLDTDWYESTHHELKHLFHRMAPGGVLIVDDYGHWNGCRQAVDQFFDNLPYPIFLQRIDYTGRLAIIPGRLAKNS